MYGEAPRMSGAGLIVAILAPLFESPGNTTTITYPAAELGGAPPSASGGRRLFGRMRTAPGA